MMRKFGGRLFGLGTTEHDVNRIAEKVVIKGADPNDIASLVVEIVTPPPFLFRSNTRERVLAMRAKRDALSTLGDIAVSLGMKPPWSR